MEETNARVFISCGQRKDTDEAEIAGMISKNLEEMGYIPYIAIEEQTLRGLRENIFERLRESEYLIFVDFKREKIGEKHRGSLFSHQELAIAAFLGIEVIAFQEEGVKKDDGILSQLQTNCIPFSNRKMLPDKIINEVRKKWNPNWRNEMELQVSEKHDRVEYQGEIKKPGYFYHIEVKNLHRGQIAHNCKGYLESVKNLSTGKRKDYELIEFKWKGITTPQVSIQARRSRHLDAFHIFVENPKKAKLGINPYITDYSGFYYELEGPNDFELDFVVFSDSIPLTRSRFKLHIGERLEDVKFEKIK